MNDPSSAASSGESRKIGLGPRPRTAANTCTMLASSRRLSRKTESHDKALQELSRGQPKLDHTTRDQHKWPEPFGVGTHPSTLTVHRDSPKGGLGGVTENLIIADLERGIAVGPQSSIQPQATK